MANLRTAICWIEAVTRGRGWLAWAVKSAFPPDHAARFLRLPGRALETLTDDPPIESTFATARSDRRAVYPTGLRSLWSSNWSRAPKKAGAVSTDQLQKLVLGVTFNNGIEVIANPSNRQPATAAA